MCRLYSQILKWLCLFFILLTVIVCHLFIWNLIFVTLHNKAYFCIDWDIRRWTTHIYTMHLCFITQYYLLPDLRTTYSSVWDQYLTSVQLLKTSCHTGVINKRPWKTPSTSSVLTYHVCLISLFNCMLLK